MKLLCIKWQSNKNKTDTEAYIQINIVYSGCIGNRKYYFNIKSGKQFKLARADWIKILRTSQSYDSVSAMCAEIAWNRHVWYVIEPMRALLERKVLKNANSIRAPIKLHHVGHNYDIIGMFDVHNSTNVLTSKVYSLCDIVISLLCYASGLRLKSRIDVINHSLRNAGIT